MTKKQKITIASVAGACVVVLAAAIICIVIFVGGSNDRSETQPASVSTVSSLEETVPAQSEAGEETSQVQSETSATASAAESETASQAEPQQTETTSQQTTQTAPQTTTQTTAPATTTSQPAAPTTPTTSTPAAAAPTTPTQPTTSTSTPATPAQPSLEDQIAEFDARAPQIIQLAYQKLAAIGVTAVPNAIDPNTDCWTGSMAGTENLAGKPAPWEDWAVDMEWSDERCANDFLGVIQSMWELDGRKITGVQIEYLGVNYGTYIDNRPTFRIYNWQ